MSQAAGAEQSGPPAIAVATLPQDRTLLIADDDVAFRNRIARALELRGFIVTAVGSVAEALSQTSRSPAFAVLDLSCPRIFWTPICPTGGIHDEVEHEPNRNQRCE